MKRWLGMGFWAVSDQGLFASSNFVLNVLLARWLAPEEYGAFVVMYAAFALVGVLHDALLIEPMLVFGPGKHGGRMSGYVRTLLHGHAGFSVLVSLLLLLGGAAFALADSGSLGAASMSLAAAGPFILFLWLMRRACYANFKPYLATFGGALYMLLLLAGVYALYGSDSLSPASAFGLMGGASLASGSLLVACLGINPFSFKDTGSTGEIVRDHLGYGRWSAAARGMGWITEVSYLVFLSLWSGLDASAAMRALMNLIMPIVQVYSALAVILLPNLVQSRGGARFKHLAKLSAVLFISSAALYWLVLGLVHQPLIVWLYDGRYTEYSGLIWVLGGLPLIVGVVEILGTVLRALGRIDRVFLAEAASAAVALTVGTGALIALGVVGAVVWLAASYATSLVVMVWILAVSRQASHGSLKTR